MFIELITVDESKARSFVCDTNVENGGFVLVDGLATVSKNRVVLDGQVYKAKQLTDVAGDMYAFVAPDNHRYDERTLSGDVPVTVAGKTFRGYIIDKGQEIRVEDANINGEVAVGDLLAPKAGTHQLAKAEASATNVVGKVVKKEKWHGKDTTIIMFVH